MKIHKMKLWDKKIVDAYAFSMLVEECPEESAPIFRDTVDAIMSEELKPSKPMRFEMLLPGEYVISYWKDGNTPENTERYSKLVDKVTAVVKDKFGEI